MTGKLEKKMASQNKQYGKAVKKKGGKRLSQKKDKSHILNADAELNNEYQDHSLKNEMTLGKLTSLPLILMLFKTDEEREQNYDKDLWNNDRSQDLIESSEILKGVENNNDKTEKEIPKHTKVYKDEYSVENENCKLIEKAIPFAKVHKNEDPVEDENKSDITEKEIPCAKLCKKEDPAEDKNSDITEKEIPCAKPCKKEDPAEDKNSDITEKEIPCDKLYKKEDIAETETLSCEAHRNEASEKHQNSDMSGKKIPCCCEKHKHKDCAHMAKHRVTKSVFGRALKQIDLSNKKSSLPTDHWQTECRKGKDEKDSIESDDDDFNFLHHQGFKLRPETTMMVYIQDSATFSNFPQTGGIPRAWLCEERWRLHTYSKYPHNTAKSAILLAEAGFVYVGTGKGSDDSVVCFFCGCTKRDWREEEDIKETHRALSPTCPMVTGDESSNVPLIPPTGVAFGGNMRDIDTDGSHQAQARSGQTLMAAQSNPSSFGNGHQSKPVQMGTSTVMAPPAPKPPTFSGEVVIDTVNPYQPADDGASSSTVTSSNTTPAFRRSEESSGPASLPHHQTSSSSNSAPHGSAHQANPNTASSSGQSGHTSSSTRQGTVPQQNSVSSTERSGSSNVTPPSSPPTNTSSQNTSNQAPSAPNNNTSGSASPPAAPASSQQPAQSQNPTYHDLGIITERPKRYEYAVRYKRLETYGEWPQGHHLKKEDLADAGFYYAGYGDCARCFYCGGGLRNWEQEDDVWVEHARWFPKCAFIRQRVGQVFVDTVAHFARDHEKITFKMVVDKMKIDPSAFQIDSKETPLKNDAAVLAVRGMGYRDVDIIPAATSLKENGQILSADILYDELEKRGAAHQQDSLANFVPSSADMAKDEEIINTVKQKNNDLRLQTLCKICMDKEVAVVFLPCGHLVCCTECASAMKDCPVCRKQVKGIVRAFMG